MSVSFESRVSFSVSFESICCKKQTPKTPLKGRLHTRENTNKKETHTFEWQPKHTSRDFVDIQKDNFVFERQPESTKQDTDAQKETHKYKKRPINTKRNAYIRKENFIFEKQPACTKRDTNAQKETHVHKRHPEKETIEEETRI